MAGKGGHSSAGIGAQKLRLDKWLFFARLAKTRTVAVELIEGSKVRINGSPVKKPGFAIGPGDVLTLRHGGQVRLLQVLACGDRRGPASEAALLYLDLEAAPPGEAAQEQPL